MPAEHRLILRHADPLLQRATFFLTSLLLASQAHSLPQKASFTEYDIQGNLWLKFSTVPGKLYFVQGSNSLDKSSFRTLVGGVFYGDGQVKSFFIRQAPPPTGETPVTFDNKPIVYSDWIVTLGPSDQPGNNLTMLVTRVKQPPETSWTIRTTQPIMRPFDQLGFSPTDTYLHIERPEHRLIYRLDFNTSTSTLDLTGIPEPSTLAGTDAEEWQLLDANKLNAMGFLHIPTLGPNPAPRPEGTVQFFQLHIDEPDTNGNSLPDFWELQYNLDVYAQGDAAQFANADPDGDGRITYDEFLAGTNPNVPDNPPVVPVPVPIPDSLAWLQTNLTNYQQIAAESDPVFPKFQLDFLKEWATETTKTNYILYTLSVPEFTIKPRVFFPWPPSWTADATASITQSGIKRERLDSFKTLGTHFKPAGSTNYPHGNTQNANVRVYTHRVLTAPEKLQFLVVSQIGLFDFGNAPAPQKEYRFSDITFTLPIGTTPRFSNAHDVEPKYNEDTQLFGGQFSELFLVPVKLTDLKDRDDPHDDVDIQKRDMAQPITNANIAWIEAHTSAENAAPRMPQLEFSLKALPSTLTLQAKLEVQYNRGNGSRIGLNQTEDRIRIPSNGEYLNVQGNTWSIWEAYANEGFFGGDATLTYRLVNAAGYEVYAPQTINFRIGGKNPASARAKAYIEAQPDAGPTGNLWYAYAIARHETANQNAPNSRYNQFCQLPYHPNDVGRPMFGHDSGIGPGGYGIMQITIPIIPRRRIWNWQENVLGGLTLMAEKRDRSDSWMEQQRDSDNANGEALPSLTIRGVTFADGTARTMNHAVAIKLYNGAEIPDSTFVEPGEVPGFILYSRGSDFFCYWRNSASGWALSRYNRDGIHYVDRVCQEIE